MMLSSDDQALLRRRFNPDGSVLRRQQLRMLELLVAVDDICRRHDIRYWLSSGTLIGAVRHDGFIPWDDDLDIEMLRDDYLRLLDVLPRELPDTMALQTEQTDSNYFLPYAKVRDRRSLMSEPNNYDRAWKEQGIFIDILPMERQRMCLHLLSEKTFGHLYKIWRTSTDDASAIRRVRRIFRLNTKVIFPMLRLLNRLSGAHIITSGLGLPYHKPRYEDDIFPLSSHVFEGLQFPVPRDTDHHLRCLFGDYTQLPDLDRLAPHTAHIEIWQ